jgi:hypothetical protein
LCWDFAEELHDLVDDVVLRQPCYGTIATTFHNDEPLDDIVNFFVYATTLEDIFKEALLAIVEPEVAQDSELLSLLQQECP